MIFFRFISALYLKNFFIIFASLVIFFVGIDLILNFKNLPQSANLSLLYVLFLICMATNYVFALSLVFALILSLIHLIRTNELVSLYALGLSKKRLICYPFLWAFLLCVLFVALHFTPFAYAENYRSNILKNATLISSNTDIFFKFNNDFIYIKHYDAFKQELEGVKIFTLKEGKVELISAVEKASLKQNRWVADSGFSLLLPLNLKLFGEGLREQNLTKASILQGIDASFLEALSNESAHSIKDILSALREFRAQNLATSSLRLELYKMLFMPFFAPFLMLLLFVFFPTTARFFNLAFISFIFFLSTLLVYALLFLGARFASNLIISAELGILAPLFVLILSSLLVFFKKT